MKNIYLMLSIAGFIIPNIPVVLESIDAGNILLWLNPGSTMEGMFGNRISTAFILDLLFAVMVFFIWTYHEGKKWQLSSWKYWLLTILFGMAGTLPLFLYHREKVREKKGS
jgi:hypothetical protein